MSLRSAMSSLNFPSTRVCVYSRLLFARTPRASCALFNSCLVLLSPFPPTLTACPLLLPRIAVSCLLGERTI